MVGALYRNDGLLYMTQSVTTQRGFIVSWVARVSIDGKVGPTDGRPVRVGVSEEGNTMDLGC